MAKVILLSALILLLPLGNAIADVVASQSGTDDNSWALTSDQALAASWASTQSFSNVTVEVTLDGLRTDESTVDAFLTDNIGSSATPADVLASNSFVYSAGIQDETFTVFSGLTLNPGTYYLVLYNPGTAGVWWGSVSPTQVTAPGVTIAADEFAGTVNAANPYESTFEVADPTLGLHYSVTGDPVSPVPEPSSMLALAGIFVGAGVFKLRRACNRQ